MTARLLLVLPVIAVLAACTTGGGATGGGDDTDGSPGTDTGSGSTVAADCSVFDGTEAEPFSSSLITSAPEEGTVWGDGTTFAIQLSDEAIAAGLLPQVEFFTVFNGGLQTAANQIFDEDGDGAYSNKNNVFDDTLEDQPGIAQVFAISDATFDGAVNSGQELIMGNYCITFKN